MGKSEQICDCEIIHHKIVKQVKSEILADDILHLMTNFYKAFSDSTRIKIINALTCHEMCVCDISEKLNMSMSAISHQLRVLKNSRLVKYRKQGKSVLYSLDDDHIKTIINMGVEHIEE